MSPLVHFLAWRLRLAAPQTQTSPAERGALARHAAGRRQLVEIGVWHGVSTVILRRAMAPEGVLYAVDPFPPGRLGTSFQERIAHREVGRVARGRVRWIRQTGAEGAAAARAAGLAGADFVFIDGDHSFAGIAADWAAWGPLVVPGGVVALHDSRSSATRDLSGAGSARFTRERVQRDGRFEPLEEVDTLTVVRRRGDA